MAVVHRGGAHRLKQVDVVAAIPGGNRRGEVTALTDYVRACRERARRLGLTTTTTTTALGP
ncbi:hypothetical protein CA850_28935 [Micromonospora echinospora]|nr:hypothetical protein CA850_28935 [Micromonospora echinospora]